MELWIRSQDKECLMKMDRIDYDLSNGQHKIKADGFETLLGTYATKERAFEVLDEIQRILQPIIFIKDEQESFIGKDGNIYKMNVEGMKNSEIQELSTYVYEMPEE